MGHSKSISFKPNLSSKEATLAPQLRRHRFTSLQIGVCYMNLLRPTLDHSLLFFNSFSWFRFTSLFYYYINPSLEFYIPATRHVLKSVVCLLFQQIWPTPALQWRKLFKDLATLTGRNKFFCLTDRG
ncbi:hypothetical protein N665_1175s0005 [Sinapis alba]|nr:hypothetical protein N665_1175s0005 [Sinapis alba]